MAKFQGTGARVRIIGRISDVREDCLIVKQGDGAVRKIFATAAQLSSAKKILDGGKKPLKGFRCVFRGNGDKVLISFEAFKRTSHHRKNFTKRIKAEADRRDLLQEHNDSLIKGSGKQKQAHSLGDVKAGTKMALTKTEDENIEWQMAKRAERKKLIERQRQRMKETLLEESIESGCRKYPPSRKKPD